MTRRALYTLLLAVFLLVAGAGAAWYLRGAEGAGHSLGDEPGPLLVAGQDVAEAAAAGQGVVEGQVGPAGDAGQGGDPLPFEQADDEVCAGQLHGSAPR